eukprot:1192163-Prorocentrum_minimum.AAC.1
MSALQNSSRGVPWGPQPLIARGATTQIKTARPRHPQGQGKLLVALASTVAECFGSTIRTTKTQPPSG